MKAHHQEIMKRIEEVRMRIGLSQSRFSHEIGVTQTTYNRFVGPQKSKPSCDLIFGICSRWKVNANWLVLGAGPMFQDADIAPDTLVPLPPHREDMAAVADRLRRGAGELMMAAEMMRPSDPLRPPQPAPALIPSNGAGALAATH